MNTLREHVLTTRKLARSLKGRDVFDWLLDCGYFPESYVLPPCFVVARRPPAWRPNFTSKNNKFQVPRAECVQVHFPRTSLTDRTFGIIDPHIHADIAYHISRNWKSVVNALVPRDSSVATYSFPVPIDSKHRGRLGTLRTGRSIYEFLSMIDDDIAAIAYRYRFIVKTDIKNFYPSIYTHSLAWALHGKRSVRRPKNIRNYALLGNKLDRLFQCASDGCTNGLPIGPVVSDIAAELVASGVDRLLSRGILKSKIDCEVVRFKDDYRILVKSEADAHTIIKLLQGALKDFNLELSDDKTVVSPLPDGLFREWASMYHAVHPRRRKYYSWKEFRELYLSVLRIDKVCPGSGVIDRFLADIITRRGRLKVEVAPQNLQKVISMLLMMASLRTKSFPKVMAIVEAILDSKMGRFHREEIVGYLDDYLRDLAADERRNKYLIMWISYFLVSNGLRAHLSNVPRLKDPVVRTALHSRSTIFAHRRDYKLFVGCRAARRRTTLLQHLEIFHPQEAA